MDSDLLKSGTPEFPKAERLTAATNRSSHDTGFHMNPIRSLRQHRTLAAWVGGIVFISLVGFALLRKPAYEAESDIYVDPSTTDVMEVGQGTYDAQRYDSTLQQYIQTLERRELLIDALKTLPEGVWRKPGEPLGAAAARLASGLHVERQGASYQMAITLSGTDPDDTPRALNALVQQFLTQVHREANDLFTARQRVLGQERVDVEKELAAAQNRQSALNESLGVASIGTSGRNPIDDQLDDLRGQLASARREYDLASSQLTTNSPNASSATDDDPVTMATRNTINQRKATLMSEMVGMTPLNPIYQQDQLELANLDRQMVQLTAGPGQSRAEQKLKAEMRRASNEETLLEQQIAQLSLKAASSGPSLQHASELANEIDHLQERLAAIDTAIRAAKLDAISPARLHVAVAAVTPAEAKPGKQRLMLLAAFPMALLAGIFAAELARRLRARIYIAEDVRTTIGFPPLAELPSPQDVSDKTSDEYLLRLAAAIESAYLRTGSKSYTFTCIGNAIEARKLIGDVQTKLYELGYASLWIKAKALLRTEQEFERVHGRTTSIGHFPDLGKDGLAAVRLNWLKQNYDIVLIESGPLLTSAEAEYAARRSDATVLVLNSGETKIADLRNAVELLEKLRVRGVGVVVQDVRLHDADLDFCRNIQVLEAQSKSPRSQESDGAISVSSIPNEDTSPGGDADFLARVTPIQSRQTTEARNETVSKIQ